MGLPIRSPAPQAVVDAATPSPVAPPADGVAALGEFAIGAPALAVGVLALLLTAPRALGAAKRAPFAILAWLVALAVLTFAAAERLGRSLEIDDVAAHTAWTAAAPDGPRAELAAAAAAIGAGFTVAAVGGEAVPHSVAVAAARAARADAVSLIWSGPFDAAAVLAPVSAGLVAHTVRPPTPVDPARLGLRAVRAPVAGRPAAVELRVAPPESPVGREVATAITVAIGGELFTVEVPPFGDDEAPFTTELGWLPAGAGSFDVGVVWSGPEPWRATARGVIDVAAPRDDVLVAGAGAAEFVAALAVQGIGAGVMAEPTDDALDPATTLVLLDVPTPSLAARIPDFVDAGGGLVLAGAGLPAAEAPLAALSPLVALPRPAAAPIDGAGPGPGPSPDAIDGDAAAAGGPEPVGPPAPPDAGDDPSPEPPDRPEPSERPEPGGPPLPDDGSAPAGDVSTADPSSGVERAAVERRRIAMALVIDRSGSMIGLAGRGTTRMQLAKRSAKDTALALEADDELGIVAFGVGASAVRDLGPLPEPAELERRLAELRATDSRTQLAAGVQQGLEMLRDSEAPVRSLVVITDADSLDPVEVARAHAAAIEAREAGITVSLIVITNSVRVADIKAIATDGGGAFALSVDGADLPRLVMTEVRRAQRAAGRRVDDATRRPDRNNAAGGPASERVPDRAADATGEAGDAAPRVDPAEAADPPADAAADEADEAAAPIGPEAPPDLGAGSDDRPAAPTAAVPVFPVEPSPLVDPWAEDRFPPLVREPFVRHQPRALVLLATGAGNPVLAVRPFGLGRVAAFAPEWQGDELVAWRADARLPAWLATWVRAVEPTLVAPPPADALVARSVEPPAPTAAEVRALERIAVGPLRPLAAWSPPEPQTVERARPRGHDDALWALLALLLLAVSERLSRLP